MTDTQILSITIAVVFPVMGIIGAVVAVLYSNSRITDLGKTLDTRMGDLVKHLEGRMDAFEKRITERVDNGFEHMELLLKLHEAEHHHK